MRVVAGTLNPVKLRGIEQAFRDAFGSVEVMGVCVDPGVSKQPMSLEEAVRGAINRAVRARDAGPSDYTVGIEAGTFSLAECRMEVQVAAVVDAEGRLGLGLSPAFPLPPPFAKALEGGEAVELEEVVDRYFGTRGVGEAEGLVGLLTRNRVTREDLTRQAVLMALIPFLNRDLWLAHR